jgi:hypothetical protein
MRVLADANAPVIGPLDEAELPVSGFDQPACPTQRIQFHKGQWPDTPPARAFVQAGAEGDVDGDGSVDRLAVLYCVFAGGEGGLTTQVAAYSQDGRRLIGQVLDIGRDRAVNFTAVGADGSVQVVVSGPVEGLGGRGGATHTLRWNGRAFVETSAPVPLAEPQPTTLSVTAVASGGVLEVEVRNSGPSTDQLRLELSSPARLAIAVEDSPTPLIRSGCEAYDCQWALRIAPAATDGTAAAGSSSRPRPRRRPGPP